MGVSKPVRWTHVGRLGLCPVLIAEPESDGPIVEPRYPCTGWLLWLSVYAMQTVAAIQCWIDPEHEPEFAFVITGRIIEGPPSCP